MRLINKDLIIAPHIDLIDLTIISKEVKPYSPQPVLHLPTKSLDSLVKKMKVIK